MVKIKRKVEMTLPELITWAWKNDIHGMSFNSKRQINILHFDMGGGIQTHGSIDKDDIFTVEVEEEITENTKLPKFLEIFAYKNLGYSDENSLIEENKSIKEILEENEDHSLITKAIHLVNDDETHTLIWKDGELV